MQGRSRMYSYGQNIRTIRLPPCITVTPSTKACFTDKSEYLGCGLAHWIAIHPSSEEWKQIAVVCSEIQGGPDHKRCSGLYFPENGKICGAWREQVHEYPDLNVHLTLFHAIIQEGIPQKLEHNDIRWITVNEIDQYEFCPADEEILTKLKLLNGREN